MDVSERRQRALELRRRDGAPASSQVVARAARAIIEDHSDRLAVWFGEELAARDSGKALTVLIKPVGDSCNLRCRYCFNHPEQPVSLMSDAVLEAAIKGALALSPVVNLSFHGGEPLLGGVAFFERAVDLVQQHSTSSHTVRWSVQSNGTLLDDGWAQFFAANEFRVGVSIDGPADIHDANRVDAAGRGSMGRLLEGIQALGRHGICPGAISVVTCPPIVPAGKLYELIEGLGITRWRANPCRAPGQAGCYGAYVEDLFDAWVCGGGTVSVGIITDTLAALLGYIPSTCWMGGTCDQFIGIDPDGTVSPCCEMTVEPEFHFGSIASAPLEEVVGSAAARSFRAKRAEGDAGCEGCDWRGDCRGGCTFARIQQDGCPSGHDHMCDAYRDTFERIRRRVDEELQAGVE